MNYILSVFDDKCKYSLNGLCMVSSSFAHNGCYCDGIGHFCGMYAPASECSTMPDIHKIDEPDQTLKADNGKPKLTLVPQQIIFDIAKVREYGLKKYGASESWKDVDIQRYRDATYRHFLAYLKDPQGNDDESGLPHLSHLACNIAFLCELENNNKEKTHNGN